MKFKLISILLTSLLLSFSMGKQEKKYKVEMSVEKWNVVITALNELPAKISNPVIQDITIQVQNQMIPDSLKNKKPK